MINRSPNIQAVTRFYRPFRALIKCGPDPGAARYASLRRLWLTYAAPSALVERFTCSEIPRVYPTGEFSIKRQFHECRTRNWIAVVSVDLLQAQGPIHCDSAVHLPGQSIKSHAIETHFARRINYRPG